MAQGNHRGRVGVVMAHGKSWEGLRRVRVINGPLRDATYPLRARLSIGRGYDADLQIVDRAVSRQHAEIIDDEMGGHVLVDLDSSNGTMVDDTRVRRRTLTPGTVFRIAGTELIYEDAPREPACVESGVYAMRYSDPRTYRGTMEYRVVDMDIPGYVSPTSEPDAPARRRWGSSDAVDGVPLVESERLPVNAVGPDGKAYDGSVLDDILNYRELRTKTLRRETVSRKDVAALHELEGRLRPKTQDAKAQPSRHAYLRFACRIPARLRFASGQERPVMVVDVGVDGAKIVAPDHDITPNMSVWLAIDFVSRERAQTVVLTSRAVRGRGDEVGLSFAGAPDQPARVREHTVRTRLPLEHGARAARTTRWSTGRVSRRLAAGSRGRGTH